MKNANGGIMKKIGFFFICIFLLCFVLNVYGQSLHISGTTTDGVSHEPIAGVLVTIRPTGENKIVKFAQTSPQGKFELQLAQFPENHVLHFSMMGFAPQTISLKTGQTVYDVQLVEQATELKEVIVKAPGIHQRGDTITYVVSSFADAQDKSLADVLKKMPGIEVEKNGVIKYNGVFINKFYIEGKDMLGGRYGIATNNIHQQDVGSVEVMENHQPIKALEDISFSQNPGINIRLKEDAKARWVGTMKAGVGFEPFLWNTELTLMRFKKSSQTLNTYKSNNIGNDLIRETMSFAIDEVIAQFSKNYVLDEYLSVSPTDLREIDGSRSRFNNTHLVTTNNLWSLGKNFDLTSQVTYTNHRQTWESSTVTSFFLPDSTIVTELAEHASGKENRLSGDLTLAANTPSYYFKNKLLADLRWKDIDMHITGTFPNKQIASIPYRKVSNDFEILKRSGRKAYTLNSYNLYQTKPQHLTVIRENNHQQQTVQSSAFYTNTNTSFSFFLNPVTVSMKMGAIGVVRSLETLLTGVDDSLGKLNNNLAMRYMNLYVSPEMEFKKSGFEAKLDVPISFVPYRYTDRMTDKKQNNDKLFFSPRLYMRYHFTSRLSASLSGRYAQSPLQEQSFYEGLILNNYRNISRGFIDYKLGDSKTVSVNMNYRSPLKAIFANAAITRSWNYVPRISNRYFLDEYLLNTYIPQDNCSDMWMGYGTVSKGVDALNGIISVRSSYSAFNGSLFQNEKESLYSSDSWKIAPKLTSRISKWGNVAYEVAFSQNWQKIKDTDMRTSYKNLSQILSCNITPNRKWYLQLTGEHYCNEIMKNVYKHLLVADAEFTYSFQNGWEFNLSLKNIFNQNVYAYTYYDNLTSVNREFRIRTRNVMTSLFFRF